MNKDYEKLFHAVRWGNQENLMTLISTGKYDLNKTEYQGLYIDGMQRRAYKSLVMEAAMQNNVSNLILLKTMGADIHYQDKVSGMTAYLLAVAKGNSETIEMLEQWGVDTTLKDNYGETALHLSCIEFNSKTVNCVKRVLRSQDVKTLDNQGNNALSKLACAVRYDMYENSANEKLYCESLKLLVDSGADINQRNLKGDTPLLLYLKSDLSKIRFNVIKTFLELDANPNLKNCKSLSAHDLFTKHVNQIKQWNKQSEDVTMIMEAARDHHVLMKKNKNAEHISADSLRF